MVTWPIGRRTIEYLMEKGRLERIADDGAASTAELILVRSERRLGTARSALSGGDIDGSFVAAYDAYRMAAESMLTRQGLRATGGEGSHVTVEDAASAQFADAIPSLAKPIFDRFRRTRHSAQYFDPDAPELTSDDADWAIDTADACVSGARRVVDGGELERFDSP